MGVSIIVHAHVFYLKIKNKSTINAPVSTLGILNVASTRGTLFRTFSLTQSQYLMILLGIDYFCCALHANYLHHHTVN